MDAAFSQKENPTVKVCFTEVFHNFNIKHSIMYLLISLSIVMKVKPLVSYHFTFRWFENKIFEDLN